MYEVKDMNVGRSSTCKRPKSVKKETEANKDEARKDRTKCFTIDRNLEE